MSVLLLHALSGLLQDIVLFRYNEVMKEIFILAGETLEITIFANGPSELDDATG